MLAIAELFEITHKVAISLFQPANEDYDIVITLAPTPRYRITSECIARNFVVDIFNWILVKNNALLTGLQS